MFHVLGDDVDGPVLRADAIQLHQVGMLKFAATRSELNWDSTGRGSDCMTHVMTLASSMKSSSDIVPPFIIFTAVSIEPRHFPRRTTPNWPEPSSSISISSDGWISHLSCDKPAVGGTGRSHGDDFSRQAKPPELCRW